ncbi:hypothetical protein BZG36_02997 [Bifiguratus adelaidae]|uniref:Peroxisomal biogenesis factor 11 n=1 Tax=Bifiguratus adelaidae TaxID=1938954 RepID=A0A261XYC3_9FUNG|nr:hypothetical protein BZG36_02997 [Bifiguratus adelaidae]
MTVTLDQVLRFLNTTNGREKTYRGVQYFARFYAWHLFRQGATKDQIARWTNLKNTLAVARKLYRLGKPLEAGQSAYAAVSHKDEFIRFTQLGRQIGYFGYYVCEMIGWLHSIGFYKNSNNARVLQTGFKLWLAALLCSIASGLYKLREINLRASVLERSKRAIAQGTEKEAAKGADVKVESKLLEKERYAVNYQMTQDVLDALIPAATLDYIGLDDGIVGLAGLTTSIMGGMTQWKKVNGDH